VTFGEGEAVHYEAWYETPEGRRADGPEKAVLGWLLQAFPRPGSVLEVGCGTAHVTHWLNDQELAAAGLDLSTAMLAEAPRVARCGAGRAQPLEPARPAAATGGLLSAAGL